MIVMIMFLVPIVITTTIIVQVVQVIECETGEFAAIEIVPF